MPFGKYKGFRVSVLPSEYLGFLTTTFVFTAPQWRWLRDSVLSELRIRGLPTELVLLDTGCQAAVTPYWNEELKTTIRVCGRSLPCPTHTIEPEDSQAGFNFEEAKFLLETGRRIQVQK
jgi:uncharacterized protein (DUF3820 family)